MLFELGPELGTEARRPVRGILGDWEARVLPLEKILNMSLDRLGGLLRHLSQIDDWPLAGRGIRVLNPSESISQVNEAGHWFLVLLGREIRDQGIKGVAGESHRPQKLDSRN